MSILGFTLYQWFSIIGTPSLIAIAGYLFKFGKQMRILMAAQKAQMRSQLLEQYHYYMDGGWISEEHMEDWENQYQAYHELVGVNGILDDRRQKLMQLPNSPQIQIGGN